MSDFLLRSFDAPAIWTHQTRRNRDGEGAFRITNGLAVIAAASTPEWLLENLTPHLVMNGVVNRLILFHGPRNPPLHMRPPFDPQGRSQLVAEVNACLAAVREKTFTLSAEAVALNKEMYERQEWLRGESQLAIAATARTPDIALKAAMLLAFADRTPVVGAEHVEAGWALANYSATIARSLVGRMREGTTRQAEERVITAARRYTAEKGVDTFTSRDIYQRLKGKHGMSSTQFNAIWKALLASSEIVPFGGALGCSPLFRLAEDLEYLQAPGNPRPIGRAGPALREEPLVTLVGASDPAPAAAPAGLTPSPACPTCGRSDCTPETSLSCWI